MALERTHTTRLARAGDMLRIFIEGRVLEIPVSDVERALAK